MEPTARKPIRSSPYKKHSPESAKNSPTSAKQSPISVSSDKKNKVYEDRDNEEGEYYCTDETDNSIPANQLFPDLQEELVSLYDKEPSPNFVLRNTSSDDDSFTDKCADNSESVKRQRNKLHARIKPKISNQNDNLFIIMICFCIITFCFVAYIIFQYSISLDFHSNYLHNISISEVKTAIENDLKYLNKQMTQSRNVWITLFGQIDSIMNDNPKQPASVIAVIPKGAEKTITCLTHRLAETFKEAFHDSFYVLIDVKSNKKISGAVLKEDIDSQLKNLNISHFAVVHNLEGLPSQAAMIFHSYCDHEYAPFKQAFILFTMEIELSYEEIDESYLNRIVDEHLGNTWQPDLSIDIVSSLLSRIGNSVIAIKPESASVLRNVCSLDSL